MSKSVFSPGNEKNLSRLPGAGVDVRLVRKVIEEAIALEGSLLAGIFTGNWGGAARASVLYAKLEDKMRAALLVREEETPGDEEGEAQRLALKTLPALRIFLEAAIAEKQQALLADPEFVETNMGLLSASEKALRSLASSGSRGGIATVLRERLGRSDEWLAFESFMRENFPVGNFEEMMEGHLDALATALEAQLSVGSMLRRGSGLRGGGSVGGAFALLGQETMKMYDEEIQRILGLAAKVIEREMASLPPLEVR